jgi:hypothetical protein
MKLINAIIIGLFVFIILLETIQFVKIQTAPKTAIVNYNHSDYTCTIQSPNLKCVQNNTIVLLPIAFKNYTIIKLT